VSEWIAVSFGVGLIVGILMAFAVMVAAEEQRP